MLIFPIFCILIMAAKAPPGVASLHPNILQLCARHLSPEATVAVNRCHSYIESNRTTHSEWLTDMQYLELPACASVNKLLTMIEHSSRRDGT